MTYANLVLGLLVGFAAGITFAVVFFKCTKNKKIVYV